MIESCDWSLTEFDLFLDLFSHSQNPIFNMEKIFIKLSHFFESCTEKNEECSINRENYIKRNIRLAKTPFKFKNKDNLRDSSLSILRVSLSEKFLHNKNAINGIKTKNNNSHVFFKINKDLISRKSDLKINSINTKVSSRFHQTSHSFFNKKL